jgi:hypothetical protein
MDEQDIAGLRPQWEHHIEYIQAVAYVQGEAKKGFLPAPPEHTAKPFLKKYYKYEVPEYAVQAILPRLNELGTQGWELVNMEPVVVGVNGDINPGRELWTNVYLCAFKRLKRSAQS